MTILHNSRTSSSVRSQTNKDTDVSSLIIHSDEDEPMKYTPCYEQQQQQLQQHHHNTESPSSSSSIIDMILDTYTTRRNLLMTTIHHVNNQTTNNGNSSTMMEESDLDQIHTVDYCLPYRKSYWMTALFFILCVVSLGVLPLLCHWFPFVMLRLTHVKSDKKNATAMLSRSTLSQTDTISYIENIQVVVAVDSNNKNNKNNDADDDDDTSGVYKQSNATHTAQLRAFYYRHACFVYDESMDDFVRVSFHSAHPFSHIHKHMSNGVNVETRMIRKSLFGSNGVNVQVKGAISLLLDEVLHPFYIFQVFSIIVWCFSDYYLYSGVILISSTLSALMSLIETRRNLVNLRNMARHSCDVNRYYNQSCERVDSDCLVPGDVIEIEDDMLLPCDVLLLSGECIMNESMLTGESIPVVKSALPKDGGNGELYSMDKHKGMTLFSGTHVLQTKTRGNEKPLGVCVRTGFDTAKGKLILSILYPRPSEFKYYRDSFKFIGLLFIISGLGMVYSSVRYMFMGIPFGEILLRGLNLVTIAVPPALPVAITVGTALAIARLKKKNIYTISPSRVNVAGKVNCMCFDKTGTLTEDGLELHGIRIVDNAHFLEFIDCDAISSFVGESTNVLEDSSSSIFTYCMTACHSLAYSSGKMVGDPLEHSIFDCTQWELIEPEQSHHHGVLAIVRPKNDTHFANTAVSSTEISIIKRYEFSSDLKRMSVILKNMQHGYTYGVVKGSPEHLKPLCTSDSIPHNFDQCLFEYAYKGFRVLACAYKPIDQSSTIEDLQLLPRSSVESDLIFLGFIIMQNKMKDDTPPTIEILSNAAIENIMVTGDNSLTAAYVARQSGIIRPDSVVYLGDVVNDEVRWKDIESEAELDPYLLKPMTNSGQSYDLAITGTAFERLFSDHKRHEPSSNDMINPPLFHRLLCLCKVYSRMSPDQKRALSEELQKIDYFVGFCGDGANDTASLKASHIGVSLSQAEASIAAPFTSLNPTISCVPTVIKEGRASLATSFQMFKFMACYSLIQFFAIIMLYDINTTLGNYQLLFVDLVVILPIVFLISKTAASNRLGSVRPSGSLLNPLVYTSLFVQMGLSILFMALTLIRLRRQSWFTPLDAQPSATDNIVCFETTSMFIISTFVTYNMAFAYSISRPFKKALYHNKIFCCVLAILLALQAYIIFFPDKYTNYWLELRVIPLSWKIEIVIYAVLHLILSYLFERFAIAGVGKKIIMGVVKRRIRTVVQNMHNTEEEKRFNKLRLSKKKYNKIRFAMLENPNDQ